MQHVSRLGLEPLDGAGIAEAGDDSEPGRDVTVESRGVDVLLEQFRVPEQWKIIHDGVVFGERDVVGQAWARVFDRHEMLQSVVGANNAVMEIGRMLRVIEKNQLARGFDQAGVRGNSVQGHPGLGSELLQCVGIEAVSVPALIEGGQ